MKHNQRALKSACGKVRLPVCVLQTVFDPSESTIADSLIDAIFGRDSIRIDARRVAESFATLSAFAIQCNQTCGRAPRFGQWLERFREIAWMIHDNGTIAIDRRTLSGFKAAGEWFISAEDRLTRAFATLSAEKRLNPIDGISDAEIIGDCAFPIPHSMVSIPENRRFETRVSASVREKMKSARRNSDCGSFVPAPEIAVHPWKRSVGNGADALNGMPDSDSKNHRVWKTRGSDCFR